MKWGYLASHCYEMRFGLPAHPVYQNAYELVKDKDYFVITSNVDGMVNRVPFGEDRIFTPQGDFQVSKKIKSK